MKKIIVANWKLNPSTIAKAIDLARKIDHGAKKMRGIEIVIAPPFPYVRDIGKILRRAHLGAQNVFGKNEGAFTGEVSAPMLVSCGARYVIIGHSERRIYARETNAEINAKVKRAASSGLFAVLCIGERDRTKENFLRFVKQQLLGGLKGIQKRHAKKIFIAYEPVWAIGTGKPVRPDDLREMAIYIRRILFDVFGRKAAHSIPVLYGGSVTSKNSALFLNVDGVSGLLVGGASLDPEEFIGIAKNATKSI